VKALWWTRETGCQRQKQSRQLIILESPIKTGTKGSHGKNGGGGWGGKEITPVGAGKSKEKNGIRPVTHRIRRFSHDVLVNRSGQRKKRHPGDFKRQLGNTKSKGCVADEGVQSQKGIKVKGIGGTCLQRINSRGENLPGERKNFDHRILPHRFGGVKGAEVQTKRGGRSPVTGKSSNSSGVEQAPGI